MAREMGRDASEIEITVFGAGGDRDTAKRPVMGRIAVEYADRVTITDDNPRTEKPEAIRRQILETAGGASEVADRALAIQNAIDALGPGDVLVIAGKGHETGQIIGDKTIPFSDHEVARTHLQDIGGVV